MPKPSVETKEDSDDREDLFAGQFSVLLLDWHQLQKLPRYLNRFLLLIMLLSFLCSLVMRDTVLGL